jgi:ABC-2 type transport system ATP-binding protein
MQILKTTNLRKTYGGKEVLRDVNMTVEEGDIYGFVGRNGAGKSTFMKVITGLVKASGGSFELFGINHKSKSSEIIAARRQLSAIIESPAFYPHMSAFDNLKVQLLSTGGYSKDKILSALKRAGLRNTKKHVKNYSLGMKQRLFIAQAIMNNSRFIILDEPTNGLDPQGMISLRALIKRLNTEEGVTFLISSHYLTELSQIINRFGVLKDGKIILESGMDDIQIQADENFESYILSLIGEGDEADDAE